MTANNDLLRVLFVGRTATLAATLQSIFITYNRQVSQSKLTMDSRLPVAFTAVSSQKAGLQQVRAQAPAVALVELEAKMKSRVQFCQTLRYRLPTTKILAIGEAKSAECFAFDAVIAPLMVAQAVLESVLQAQNSQRDHTLLLGPLTLHVATRIIATAKGQYSMTPKQSALLQLLMSNPDRVVGREEIMQLIWQTTYMEDTRTLDVHIRWLRERIEPNPSRPIYLKTVRGIGYQLAIE
jgi:DNA-binding response OmpR family regulator